MSDFFNFVFNSVLFDSQYNWKSFLQHKDNFNLTEMGNKRNRNLDVDNHHHFREIRAPEAEASQGIETLIETLGNFDYVSSVRSREAALIDTTQKENEMQVWTQRVTDNTNRELAELRNEWKARKMMREAKNSRRRQSVSNRKTVNKLHREQKHQNA